MQQPLDQRRRHPEPLGSQLHRQGPQRLRRPPQRRHRITTRLRLHQSIQRLHQTRLQHLRALTSPTRGPRPVNLQRLRVIQLITAPTHRIARNPCSRSNHRPPPAPAPTRLPTQPNPTLTLTQMRLHKVVPTHQGLSNRAHSAKIAILHPENYIILLQSLTNPFRPGAGRRPPVLAGREPILDAFTVVRRKVDELGEGDRGWILHGLRGVGKTVLLNELLAQVSDKGWIAAKVEVTPAIPLPVALASALVRSMRMATGRPPEPRLRRLLGVFKAFSLQFDPPSGQVSLGVLVDPVAGVADTGRFADDLAMFFEVLGETSRDLGIGTLILVAELQEASPADLSAVNTAVHQMGQSDIPLPIVFVGAGLPSLPAQLADATSYAERLYDYRPIGLLDATGAP